MSNSLQVFTQFTLQGQQCATGNVFQIDTCSQFCEGSFFGQFKYDSKDSDYVFTTYTDKDCTTENTQQSPATINCSTQKAIGDYTVTCANQVEVNAYKKFEINGQKGSDCEKSNKVTVDLDSCVGFCKGYTKVVSNTDVNGYTVSMFSDDKCTKDPNPIDITCKPNNQTVAGGQLVDVVCLLENNSSTNSSSHDSQGSNASTTIFSLVLLASSAVLGLLF